MFTFIESDLQFTSPFGMIISGPSGSGKTTFLLRFLSEHKNLVFPKFNSILYCYSEYHDQIKAMQAGGVMIHQGLPDDTLLDSLRKPAIVILDDLMLNASEEYLTSLFTKKSHHRNLSVIFLTQDLFQKRVKVARNNAQYIILMRAPNAALQIRNLGIQLFPTQLDYFMDAYKLATANKYGYLVIDLNPSSIPLMRLRTNIFREVDDDELTIFVPRNA